MGDSFVPEEVVRGDKKLICFHCKHDKFTSSEKNVASPIQVAFNAEAFGEQCAVFTCDKCGWMAWFANYFGPSQYDDSP